MRTIKIKISELDKAMQRAEANFDDWQAKCMEIALLPKVYKRFCELNADREPVITRIAGKSPKGMTRDDNLAVTDWTQYAGYTLTTFGLSWNRADREDWYSQCPDCCWNGMGRELRRVNFIHALRMVAEMHRQGKDYSAYLSDVRAAKIEVVA